MPTLNNRLAAKRMFEDGIELEKLQLFPEKVLQFGEGKFIRAFADWMIHEANCRGIFQGRVIVAPPRSDHLVPAFESQDKLFTLLERGLVKGKTVDRHKIIASISRILSPRQHWGKMLKAAENPSLTVIISNTTEAGLIYNEEPYSEKSCPTSYPAKLTALLYHRYTSPATEHSNPLLVIPCELLSNNGELLKEIVVQHSKDWNMPQDFLSWLNEKVFFLNNLVDRIVTGIAEEEKEKYFDLLGYHDELVNLCEPHHLWAISQPFPKIQELFPLHKAGLNVKWVDDVSYYRLRKVRILNGSHTSTVAVALLLGHLTVQDSLKKPLFNSFLNHIVYKEIIPSMRSEGFSHTETAEYAREVLERFRNPFLKHYWTDISVYSIQKFKERVMPSLQSYMKYTGKLPKGIIVSWAALLALYRGTQVSKQGLSRTLPSSQVYLQENESILEFLFNQWSKTGNSFSEIKKMVQRILAEKKLWGNDWSGQELLVDEISHCLYVIINQGIKNVLAREEWK